MDGVKLWVTTRFTHWISEEPLHSGDKNQSLWSQALRASLLEFESVDFAAG